MFKSTHNPPPTNIIILGQAIALRVVRSARRRRTVAFAVEAPATLRVTVPLRLSMGSLRDMIDSRGGWITRRLAGLAKNILAADDTNLTYLGHCYAIQITQDVGREQGCRLYPRRITVNIPNANINHAELRDEVRTEIRLWLKKRARVKMQRRMDLWAGRIGVEYQRMVISNPEHRWGSCSVKNIIRMNWRLIMAPLRVLDYVIVHELSHIVHKNHSPRYWRYVGEAMPDYQQLRRQLRDIGHSLVF